MDSQNPGSDYVEPNRPGQSYRADTADSTASLPTTSQDTFAPESRRHNQEPSPPSSQPTIVPYAPTPPPAPTPPSISSESEIYGPDRLWTHPPESTDNADRSLISLSSMPVSTPQFPPMAVLQDPTYGDFKDDLARAAGVVTPGVDDGPYIRYALDAMTRVPGDSQVVSVYRSSDSDAASFRPTYHFTPTTVPTSLRPKSVHLPPPPPPPETVKTANTPRSWSLMPSPAPVPSVRPLTAEEELQERRLQRQGEPKLFAAAEEHQQQLDRINALKNADAFAKILSDPRGDGPSEQDKHDGLATHRKALIRQPRTIDHWQPRSDLVTDPEMGLHNRDGALQSRAPLTMKPWVLQTQSLALLALLCVLMIAALVFSAIYSMSHTGLTTYGGTIYGGQYFLFRMLPQLLAIIILIYAQCVITAATWVLPFSAMASDDRNERRDAVFLPLYPKSFLWPQLNGSWNIWIPVLNVWLLNFTIPLQSSLFTVILVDGTWTWATVQGAAWTLVALYVSFLLSLVVLFVFWHRRRTGMMQKWNLRNLADIIFLIAQSNSLAQYRGLETATTRIEMKQKLGGTAERLGFWFSPESPEVGTWFGIGVPTGEENLMAERLDSPELTKKRQEGFSEAGERPGSASTQYHYLPWCFRDVQLAIFLAVCSILLLVLIIVSFLHSTDLRNGFLPMLDAGPVAGAFSAADFLFSFLPSLIGLILFLLFQPLDLTLRILTPWGELSRAEGSRAGTSLLVDYATCLPFESTYKALRNKHWRVALVSVLSPLFALLPVLGGGLFMALTPPAGIVRMYPNVPAFAIILTLLFLYIAGLVCLLPNRKQFRLPHAVTCLAEIISFCTNEQLRTDDAFHTAMMLEPHDLQGNLDLGKDWHRQGRWTISAGRTSDERFGVKRLSKYTVNPKKLRSYDKRARGDLISTPLPNNSGSLFNR
ncbi:hypothetical protein M426DRAFT_11305 [Hypoxylon sp. CI-4A]|nr:hypothetical protein M426DRAFT_11305 [Hypoxylon sp. CI-4A]